MEAEKVKASDGNIPLNVDILAVPEVKPLCDTLPNIEKERINIGDVALYCEREGKGKGMPIVLINGGPGATHHDFHPHFSEAAKFAEVIYYDQRGCGDKSQYVPGKGYTLEQAVDDLETMREKLRIDKWCVLGHSYGGVLARLYAEKYPERVSGIVLVCASDDGLPCPSQETRQYILLSDEEKKKINKINETKGLSLAQKVFNNLMNGDWKRQHSLEHEPSIEQKARTALYGWKQDADFNSIMSRQVADLNTHPKNFNEGSDIPVLLMEGEQDLTWGINKPEKMKKYIGNSQLEMFKRSAHSPFMDEPNKFFSILKDFVASLDYSPSRTQSAKRNISASNAPQNNR